MKDLAAALRWTILVSALIGLIGLQWWAVPDTNPFSAHADSLSSVHPDAAVALAGALGGAGIATAWALGRRRCRRLALAGAGAQVAVLGYAVPNGALPNDALATISRHGVDGLDTTALYGLGAMLAGALWLLVLVCEVRLAHDERMGSSRPPVRR